MADADGEPFALEQWVVYEHPADYPDYFVIRRWLIRPGAMEETPEVWLRHSLADARRVIDRNAPGAYRLDRSPGDDPVIVEVWI